MLTYFSSPAHRKGHYMIKIFVGIDVCEEKLDIFLHPVQEYVQFNNTSRGITALCKFLGKHEIEKIGMEATGKLEALCAEKLIKSGYKVSVINPAQICYFRRSLGLKAKTDVIDAEVIARFTEFRKPPVQEAKSETQIRLFELSMRRRQLLFQKEAERNRLRRVRDDYCKQDICDHIKFLETRLEKIEKTMLSLIGQDKELLQKLEILTSIPGVGIILAMALICQFPELGTLNQKQAASLAGVAPLNIESGKISKYKGVRYSGRKIVRANLYMAALVGLKHNPLIKGHYERLTALGKPKRTALGACMRKLIIVANSLVKEDRKWRN